MSFDEKTYKQGLGRLLAGVTVVTTQAGETLHGMTASAVTRLSDDPPLLLVCINHNANMHQLLQAHPQAGFAINILTVDQEALSNCFAGYGELETDPLGRASRTGHDGAPIIDGSLAWFDCERHSEHVAGSHTIYVGRVVEAGLSADADANPLTYFRGKYQTISG